MNNNNFHFKIRIFVYVAFGNLLYSNLEKTFLKIQIPPFFSHLICLTKYHCTLFRVDFKASTTTTTTTSTTTTTTTSKTTSTTTTTMSFFEMSLLNNLFQLQICPDIKMKTLNLFFANEKYSNAEWIGSRKWKSSHRWDPVVVPNDVLCGFTVCVSNYFIMFNTYCHMSYAAWDWWPITRFKACFKYKILIKNWELLPKIRELF